MMDLLFQMGLSNACLSLALAVVAMIVGARGRRPQLAYMLWLLVFVKLVTPPIVTIPIVTIPAQGETAVAINENSRLGPLLLNNPQLNVEVSQSSRLGSAAWHHASVWLPPIWLLGSVVVFAFSIVRVCRFSRLLAAKSEVARQDLQTAAVEIARRLGLNKIPAILTTSANLLPMVWWAGGRVRIVIPKALLDQMDAQQWKWILAHELAHVRRRDYLVRWLEWLSCVCFWWNPVVWWAQRNLRATEEICCDDLVLSSLNPKPKFYADSLLSAVEFLARPVLRPPAMASEINSGGFLERRFKMIVSETPRRPNARWLQACVLLCAVVVLPLGIASAQDYKAVERRLGEGVSKGELTLQQAGLMMDALRKAGGAKKEVAWPTKDDNKDAHLKATWNKLQAMVKAGKLTKEQAAAKMSAIKREAAKKDPGSERAKAYLMKVKKDLGAAVAAGRISKEDATKRYEGAEKGIKERMAAGRGRTRAKEDPKPDAAREYLIKVRKELGAAVEAGKISKEDATKRYEGAEKAVKERMAAGGQGDSRRITREDYARAEAELHKAVATGKISAEDARARLQGMRKMVAEQGERERDSERQRADYEGFERRIRAAVEAGKMTREEAGEKLKAYRKRVGQGKQAEDPDKELDYDAIGRRIRAAVAAGEITEEQARAKWEAIRKKAAARDGD